MEFFLEEDITRSEYMKTCQPKSREEYKDLLKKKIKKYQGLVLEASKDRTISMCGRDVYSEYCGVVTGLCAALQLFQEEEFKE